ncbi:hypothetical protein WMY93_031919 [Mugilogobius chulae]|uniref:Cysteine and tyrosine-rich protein 1 n=1 Tax=Mugilogobius chulae TaxID=88201 RepID=A0AAW0MF13_9GOBI
MGLSSLEIVLESCFTRFFFTQSSSATLQTQRNINGNFFCIIYGSDCRLRVLFVRFSPIWHSTVSSLPKAAGPPLSPWCVSCGAAQCEGCQEYCCTGSPPFCCSYYAYVGDVLSGTAISGIVFGVVFLMGAVAALFLCVCVCLKDGRGSRVGVLNSSYISTISHGYPGPPPPYACEYEMCPPALHPPPYTPTQPHPGHYSPLRPTPAGRVRPGERLSATSTCRTNQHLI